MARVTVVVQDEQHYKKDNAQSFTSDFMETHQREVDRVALKLISEEPFCGTDFDIQSSGVRRINPELASKLLTEMIQTCNTSQ